MPAPDNRPAVALPANPIGMSPLTGRPIGSYKPVLVVKLDNTPNAQPHAGLIDADVVYIEEVEYGITRLAAVFSSTVPRRIGPVRSARITDIDLFAQYGKPAFGYSGAQRKMFPYLKAASIYDVSPYTSGTGYSRDNGRRIPYNLFFDGRAGVNRAPKATPARDMGFVFDEQVPDGGLNATDASMRWGYASAGFDYDRKNAEYRDLAQRPTRPRRGVERRPASGHGRDPVREAEEVPVLGQGRRQHPARGDHRQRHGDGAARRPGVEDDVVAAEREVGHDVHAARRIPAAVQARPAVDRPARQEAARVDHAADQAQGHQAQARPATPTPTPSAAPAPAPAPVRPHRRQPRPLPCPPRRPPRPPPRLAPRDSPG